MLNQSTEQKTSISPEQTRVIAENFLTNLEKGAILSLHGDLGSGKTCFVQGLARALGIDQAVTSPTYTIINEYTGRFPMYHIDLYRVKTVEEAIALGIEDYFEPNGITAVEWGERAFELFPEHTINITFEMMKDPSERVITIVHPAS